MRVFEAENFPEGATDALNSSHRYDVPNQTAGDALSYITQFLVGPVNKTSLLMGYLPEDYADALVDVRDRNNSRKLSNAVNMLCVDGDVSQEAEKGRFTLITIESSFEKRQSLNDREMYTSLSDEAKDNLSTMKELIEDNRNDVRMYIPSEVKEEFEEHGVLD